MFEEIVAQVGKYTVVKTIDEARKLKPSRLFACDIETASEVGSKVPADCPNSLKQGIMGIALCNLKGDAIYMVIDDNRDYGGIAVRDAIEFLNTDWFADAEAVVIHNAKFDLSFLLARGLNLARTRVIDTWIMNSIRCEGIFTSNKLKDVVKTAFSVSVETKEDKDKFFEENKTKDYGDLPLELVAPYACDDVRFCLMLLLGAKPFDAEEWANHDLYMRNSRHLIAAERRGICVNRAVLSAKLEAAVGEVKTYSTLVAQTLGATEIDINDEQKMLHFLHRQNLHPGPRDYYGENKFVFDAEAIEQCADTPLARYYAAFYSAKTFLTCFSGQRGELTYRIFSDADENAGIHPAHQLQIYSKGGALQVKVPDVAARVPLTNEIRKIFTPRKGFKFVALTANFLHEMLLSFYCQDAEMAQCIRDRLDPAVLMSKRTEFETAVCKVLMRQVVEGSGNAILAGRLAKVGFRVNKRQHYAASDLFKSKIVGYSQMLAGVNNALVSEGVLKDRMSRRIKVPEDKRYRTHAILLNSSCGSILSLYLDIFARLASQTDAHLVLNHGSEFIFETPEDSVDFEVACRDVFARAIISPQPVWSVSSGSVWESKT
jgi:hypothetical protein